MKPPYYNDHFSQTQQWSYFRGFTIFNKKTLLSKTLKHMSSKSVFSSLIPPIPKDVIFCRKSLKIHWKILYSNIKHRFTGYRITHTHDKIILKDRNEIDLYTHSIVSVFSPVLKVLQKPFHTQSFYFCNFCYKKKMNQN